MWNYVFPTGSNRKTRRNKGLVAMNEEVLKYKLQKWNNLTDLQRVPSREINGEQFPAWN